MAILILAEHDNVNLKVDTAKVVACAQQIGSECDVLVAGYQCQSVVDAAQKLSGVRQIIYLDAIEYVNGLAENLSELLVEQAASYEHVLAAASSVGKDVLPRVAALLDVAQLSEVIKVISADTLSLIHI